MNKNILIILLIFTLGWVSADISSSYLSHNNQDFIYNQDPKLFYLIDEDKNDTEGKDIEKSSFIENLFQKDPSDLPSPSDWIKESQIKVYNDMVILHISNVQWAAFTDTNSMDPLIDSTSNALELIPQSEEEINIGDIVSYNSEYADGVIIHRVIEKDYDEKGTFFILKGDNNPNADPGKVRFNQIERVLIGILY